MHNANSAASASASASASARAEALDYWRAEARMHAEIADGARRAGLVALAQEHAEIAERCAMMAG